MPANQGEIVLVLWAADDAVDLSVEESGVLERGLHVVNGWHRNSLADRPLRAQLTVRLTRGP